VWRLHQPRVSSVLLGSKKIEQLHDNVGAVDIGLSSDDLAALAEVRKLPAEHPGAMTDLWSQSRAKQLHESRT